MALGLATAAVCCAVLVGSPHVGGASARSVLTSACGLRGSVVSRLGYALMSTADEVLSCTAMAVLRLPKPTPRLVDCGRRLRIACPTTC